MGDTANERSAGGVEVEHWLRGTLPAEVGAHSPSKIGVHVAHQRYRLTLAVASRPDNHVRLDSHCFELRLSCLSALQRSHDEKVVRVVWVLPDADRFV
eukprot:3535481-Pleurochrysis_carterae.AAC.1